MITIILLEVFLVWLKSSCLSINILFSIFSLLSISLSFKVVFLV